MVSRWESDPLKVPQQALDVFAACPNPLPTSLLPLPQIRIVCNVEVLEVPHSTASPSPYTLRISCSRTTPSRVDELVSLLLPLQPLNTLLMHLLRHLLIPLLLLLGCPLVLDRLNLLL